MNYKIEFIAGNFLGWEAQYLDTSKVPHNNLFFSYGTSYVWNPDGKGTEHSRSTFTKVVCGPIHYNASHDLISFYKPHLLIHQHSGD